MSIEYDTFRVAEVRISGLSAARGIGISRLQFGLEFNISATPDKSVRISNPSALIYADRTRSEPPLVLGHAVPETSWFAETATRHTRSGFLMMLDLGGEQVAALERLRGGGSLFFRMDFHAYLDGVHGLQRGFDQIWFEANPGVWAKVLKELGQLELLLLSVELPIAEVPEQLATAVSQVRRAYDDLVAGRYDSVVGRIRLALDGVDKLMINTVSRKAAIQAFAGSQEEREAMSKQARSALVRAAIRHYAHLAHHVDESGNPEFFSRNEAMFILVAMTSVVWDLIGSLVSSTKANQMVED